MINKVFFYLGVLFLIIVTANRSGFAEEASLLEENAQLKVRIVELEAQVQSLKRSHPASAKKPVEPNPLEAVVDPILLPARLALKETERATGSWWDNIQDGIDRVDHYFYEEDTKAWMTTEFQFDSRGFNTLNFTGASRLPAGFSVWGFADFETLDAPDVSRQDVGKFFLELDLKREIWQGFGGILEYNEGQGVSDNVGRFGLYYQPNWEILKKLDLTFSTKWFPLATNPARRQGSFAWNWTPGYMLDGRFSSGGFFDFNFDRRGSDYRGQMVSDTQFRYRLIGNLNALLEFRYNEFLIKDKEIGWGLGVQYLF